MWNWLADNADQMTAVVAVLGLLLATSLSLYTIQISKRADNADLRDRRDKALTAVLDRVVEFQYPATLPYWQAPPEKPVDPKSTEALDHHRAFVLATSLLDSAGQLELSPVQRQLKDLERCIWTLYQFAISNSQEEVRIREQQITRGAASDKTPLVQPWESAWAETAAELRAQGMNEALIARLESAASETYKDSKLGRLNLADVCVNTSRKILLEAYRTGAGSEPNRDVAPS